MALLADAFAEAHLDLDPLDRDLAEAEARLLAAFERLEERARIVVDIDTAAAEAQLDRLEARLRDQVFNVEARLDDSSFAAVEAQLEALQARIDDLEVRLNVEAQGVEETLGDLSGLEAVLQAINASEANFRVNAEGVAEALTALSSVEALKELIDGSTARFRVDADGVAEVLAGAALIDEFLRNIPDRVRTRFDLDGLAVALPQVAAIGTALALIPDRVRTVIDIDTSPLDRLQLALGAGGGGRRGGILASLFSGLQELAGAALGAITNGLDQLDGALSGVGDSIGSVFSKLGDAFGKFAPKVAIIFVIIQALGPLVSAIAALVAYLVPLATGLVAAAGGLLVFAGAATAATAAVGALALIASDGGIEGLAGLFENFKSTVQANLGDVLAPIREFLVTDVFSRFTAQLIATVGQLAPFFEATITPIVDSILRFVDVLGVAGGPVAAATGAGIGRLIDTFTRFAAVIDSDVVVGGVNALFDALDGLLELLGEAGVAFAPILNQLLTGFGNLSRDSIQPFLEIIGTFAQTIGPLGESLGNILRPLGELAIVGGQATAALAPLYDTVFQLATLVIPGLNFEALAVAGQQIVPQLAASLERLAPVIAQAADSFVTLTAAVFSDGNVAAFGQVFDGLISQFASFITLVNGFGPVIGVFFRILLEGLRASVVLAGSLQFAFVGFIELVVTAADLLADALGLVLTGIGELADLPVVSDILPEGAGDRLREWGDSARLALDGTRDFLATARGGIVDTLALATGVSEGGAALESFGGSAARGLRPLESYAVTIESVAGSLELVGPAADVAANALIRVQKAFPGTIKLLDAFKKEFGSGQLLKGALDSQAKLVQQQTQAAQRAAQQAAQAVRTTVDQTLGGGRLSELFSLSDIVPEDASEQAREAARRIQEGVQEFLGQGRLSDFLKEEKGNVDNALDSLVASLTLKAQNIRRLRFLDSLGFTDLAVQLATLADSPKALAKAITTLEQGGTAALNDANSRLARARGGIEATLSGLSPALAAALGQSFGDEATQRVEEGTDNINVALDKLADGIRQRAENIRRLQELQNLGFTDLAVQLATLADDPRALDSALDQLAAGGVAALQRANGRLASETDVLEATMRNLDPVLAAALGQTPGEQTVGAIDETAVNIFDALQNLQSTFASRLQNIRRLRFLEELGFTDLAAELAGLDPDQLTNVLDQLGAAGFEGIQSFNDQFIRARDEAFAQAAQLDPRTLEQLAQGYPEVAAAVEDGLIRTQAQVSDAIRLFGAAGAVEGSQAAVENAVIPPEVLAQFESVGDQLGAVLAESIETAAASDALRTRIDDALVAAFGGGPNAAIFPVQAVGEQQAQAFIDGTVNTLLGQGSLQITVAAAQLFDEFAVGVSTSADLAGVAAGLGFGGGFTTGLSGGVAAIQSALGAAFEDIAVALTAAAGLAGTAAGVQLALGLVDGSRAAGVLVGASFGTTLADGITRSTADLTRAASTAITRAAAIAGTVGRVQFALVGIGATESFRDAALSALRSAQSRIDDAFVLAGLSAGESFGAGAQVGITSSLADLELGFDALSAFGPTLNTLGNDLGVEFGAGFILGLQNSLTLAETVAITTALNIVLAMRRVLDINSPSGVARTIGEQFGDGLRLGLDSAQAQVAAAAEALAAQAVVDIPQPDPIVVDYIPNVDSAISRVLTDTTDPLRSVAAPTLIAQASTQPTQAALTPESVLSLLTKLDEIARQLAQLNRPLFGEYNVYGVEQPQSPDQLARDASFAKAVLGS